MTRLLLMNELVKRLKEVFAGWTLLNKKGELQAVKVFAQYMPNPPGISIGSKNTGRQDYTAGDYENNFPCVIVKLLDQTDQEENARNNSQCSVKILSGVYDVRAKRSETTGEIITDDDGKIIFEPDPECQGYRDVLNIQERIREDFFTRRIIGEKFMLLMPAKHRLIEVETWPVFFGEQEFVFETARPMMKEYIYKGQRRVI